MMRTVRRAGALLRASTFHARFASACVLSWRSRRLQPDPQKSRCASVGELIRSKCQLQWGATRCSSTGHTAESVMANVVRYDETSGTTKRMG